MNRTENFIAMTALAVIGDITNPQAWMLAFYVAGVSFFFVRWLHEARKPPAEEVNRDLLQSLTDIYNWTEHKDTAWAKRAKAAIDNATRLDR